VGCDDWDDSSSKAPQLAQDLELSSTAAVAASTVAAVVDESGVEVTSTTTILSPLSSDAPPSPLSLQPWLDLPKRSQRTNQSAAATAAVHSTAVTMEAASGRPLVSSSQSLFP
jgi:hypothetical protein